MQLHLKRPKMGKKKTETWLWVEYKLPLSSYKQKQFAPITFSF